jgi:HlyD family secretion protein
MFPNDPDNPTKAGRRALARWSVWLGVCCLLSTALSTANSTWGQSSPPSGSAAIRREIRVQGRIEPKNGILRLSGLPGDRVEAIHVAPGDLVKKETVLATMRSFELKRLELEAARLKLAEARQSLSAKTQELDLAIDLAQDRVASAEQLVESAKSLVEIAKLEGKQVDRMRDQLQRLRELNRDPLTRAAVGRLEIETKEIEIQTIESKAKVALMTAENGLIQATLQKKQADQGLKSSKKAREIASSQSPIPSLEKQIELIETQTSDSLIIAPSDVTIIAIGAEVGERVGVVPVIEAAQLTQMYCVADVYESDVGRVQIGDRATMKSSSLKEVLQGTVSRIDRVVGTPQLRSPDPLARTDFRAVKVWIEIDSAQSTLAAERLRLQVDVTIQVK